MTMRKKPKTRWFRRAVWIWTAVVVLGCAAPQSRTRLPAQDRPAECAALYRNLDRWVDAEKVHNAAGFREPGFPYLRTDRYIAAVSDRVHTPQQLRQWLRWMRALEREMRWAEVRNLSDSAVASLAREAATEADRSDLMERIAECGDALLASDRSMAEFSDALSAAAKAPDEYRTLYRALGLYPLAAIPVDLLTERVRNEFRKWFETPLQDLPARGEIVSYAHREPHRRTPLDTAALFAEAVDNPLALPKLTEQQAERLAAAYAPVFQVDEAAGYDRPGRVDWKDGRIRIDPADPVVYYYAGASFLGGLPVLQIHYSIWFSERAGPDPPWIEKGPLDGLTLRISFDQNGLPRMIDGMNTCGCYHFFIPPDDPGVTALPQNGTTDAFVPQRMPESFPDHSLLLRISSGWHQIQRVATAPPALFHRSYRLVPYAHLESLPDGGGRSSLFDENGIAKDSARIEPLLLFPLGVPSVGSMRQRGHHAIVFIGRAHFSDPYLFDRFFRF